MNLDALVRSASLIFLFHQRFLLLESVYFLISVLFYFIQKVGAPWNLTRLPQMHIDDSPVSVQHHGTQPDTTPP